MRPLNACLLTFAGIVGSCSVYTPELLEGTGGPIVDDDAGGPVECALGKCWWSEQSVEGCETAGAPTKEGRPAPGDATELPPIYVGISNLRLGTFDADGQPNDNAWQTFGLDIDGTCTSSATCPGNFVSSCTPLTEEIPFDGELCRDNTFAKLQPVAAAVPDLGPKLGIGEDVTNCFLWNGAFTIVARVSRYNGMPNDDDVRVDYYISPGLEAPPGWSCFDVNDEFLAGYKEQFPRWLASARWRISDAELSGPVVEPGQLPDSIHFDNEAFVRDGYLVGNVPDGTNLDLAGDDDARPGFDIIIQKATITAKLEREQAGTWSAVDGVIGGRIISNDLIESFRRVGFCEDNPLFLGMVNFVQTNADVLASGENNPALPCDAMSIGLAFEAGQITPGRAETRPPRPGCPPIGMGGMGGTGGVGGT